MEYNFPQIDIDPRDKKGEWILQFAKAAWHHRFVDKDIDYDEIRRYAMGKQSVDIYKKILLGDDVTDKSWMSVNWDIVPILPKFREIAISKMLQRRYDVNAYAVDPLAKSDEDTYFMQQKVKIAMRQMAQGSALEKSPVLQPNPNEPEDLEQLEMEQEFGYKHKMAMEAELGVQLIHQQNKIEKERKKICENEFDFGLAGYKEWIDENGMVKFRAVTRENLVLPYCVEPDFSDMEYCGEVIEVMVHDLVPYFDAAQIKQICESVKGKNNNPSVIDLNRGRFWDGFKVQVLDLEFLSWNTTVYKQKIDTTGNQRFLKTDFEDVEKTRNINTSAGQEPKYIDNTRKVIYQTKWIIGTDFQYDEGLSKNMKRKQSSWWDTTLSYHLYSWNFNRMQFTGITERLMPVADNFQLTWLKLQNLKNKLIPYLIDLDLDALENVNLGKGGAKMTEMEILDLMLQTNVLVNRRKDISGENINYKAVDIRDTGMLGAFVQLYQDLDRSYMLMQQISGLNEFTDASTPNPKSLTTTANMAYESTNNALYLCMDAEKQLLLTLSDAIIQKIQIAVKLGKVAGYLKALGSDTVKFLQINPDISAHEFGIFLDDSPTDQERQMFMQDLNLKDSQGLISPADKMLVQSCRNLKQAGKLLAYKMKKREEQLHQMELEKINVTTQQQQQSAVMTGQMQQQLLQMQEQLELNKINAQGQWDYILGMMKLKGSENEANILAQSKLIAAQIAAEAKAESDKIKAKAAKKK